MFEFRRSIKWSFFLILIPLVLVFSMILSLMIVRSLVRSDYRELTEKLSYSLEIYSRVLSYPLWNVNDKEAQNIILSLKRDSDIQDLAVLDERQRIFASTSEERFGAVGEPFVRKAQGSAGRGALPLFFQIGLMELPPLDLTGEYAITFLSDGIPIEIGTVIIILSDEERMVGVRSSVLRMIIYNIVFLLSIMMIISTIFNVTIRTPIKAAVERFSVTMLTSHFEMPVYLNSQNEVRYMENTLDMVLERYHRKNGLLGITLKSIDEGIITTDTGRRISYMNPIAEKIVGWEYTDAINKELKEVVHFRTPDRGDGAAGSLENWLEGKGFYRKELILRTRDGRDRSIELSVSRIHDPQNAPVGSVLVFADVTERNRFKDIMIRNQKLEAIGVLAGGIAHDFNNYLAGIMGYVEISRLLLENNETEVLDDNLRKILTVVKRSKSLTQQLLTYSKGGTPHMKIQNLSVMIRDTVEFSLSGSNCSSRLEISEDLMSCLCDSDQIAQCINNIVINGIQAMPSGGQILVRAENDHLKGADYVKLSIRDQGEGIPAEEQEKIFDPFYTTKHSGHGLGLSTVNSVILKNKGWVEVHSESGSGTEFNIYLPAVKAGPESAEKETTSEYSGSGTVLIMDDQDYILDILEQMLLRFGYDVIKTSDGTEAVEAVSKDQDAEALIKACFLDLTVPGGMGGEAASVRIGRLSPSVKRIAISGFSDNIPAWEDRVLFDGFILKPFSSEDLQAELKKLGL